MGRCKLAAFAISGAFACMSGVLAAPAVTLSPSVGHPKIITQVSGSGFTAREAVDVYFDTTDLLLTFTDGSGAFPAHALTVPASAPPGTHWITAIGRKSGDGQQRSFIVSTPWVSHGFNERGRRRNPYENTINTANVANLDVAWTAATGDWVFSSPAAFSLGSSYNPYIFAGSEDGNLYAFSASGKLKWKAATGAYIESSPAVGPNGTVYIGSYDGKLYAFKGTNGSAAWASPVTLGGAIWSSPTVANGVVYVGNSEGKLYALKASTGAAAWGSPAMTSGAIRYSSPAVANGQVFIGSSDGSLYAFNATSGAFQWSRATSNFILSSPAVADGTVYFGSEDFNLYAVNAKTGTVRWSYATGGVIISSPAVSGNFVYVASHDGKLYVIDARSGSLAWTGVTGLSNSSPAVANGVVYLGSTETGQLYAFSANGCGAATCSPLWVAQTGGDIDSSPAVADGMVFVGSDDRNLYAFALDAGNAAVYKNRNAPPPSYASLHPDLHLKPMTHGHAGR